MPTIAQLKQQVDRIWVASFQTDLTDTLAAHLRRSALAVYKPPSKQRCSKNLRHIASANASRTAARLSSVRAPTLAAC